MNDGDLIRPTKTTYVVVGDQIRWIAAFVVHGDRLCPMVTNSVGQAVHRCGDWWFGSGEDDLEDEDQPTMAVFVDLAAARRKASEAKPDPLMGLFPDDPADRDEQAYLQALHETGDAPTDRAFMEAYRRVARETGARAGVAARAAAKARLLDRGKITVTDQGRPVCHP